MSPAMLTKTAKRLLFNALEDLRGGLLEIACPDQTYTFGDPGAELRGLVVIHDERVFRRAVLEGEIGLGEAFMDGGWSSPNLVSVLRIVMRNLRLLEDANRWLATLSRWWELLRHRLRANTLLGSRRNIAHHYDLGNRFYRLFLDPTMAYSSGVFTSPQDSLETAQRNKFDLICRKLRLEPGDRLLEIGTGWGGFAVHAATRYGCRVTTTTISREQHEYAAAWFARAGLGRQITLLFEDYRNLRGQFDKLVSIEMFEAVGMKNYDGYFAACDRLLKSGGAMLLQTITNLEQRVPRYRGRRDWIQKHIFPGAELASVAEILGSLARSTGLALFHAQDIGMHYAHTLAEWRRRFFTAIEEVRGLGFDERFVRMWHFYLASCEGGFRERVIGDFQLLLTKAFNPAPLFDEPWVAGDAVASVQFAER